MTADALPAASDERDAPHDGRHDGDDDEADAHGLRERIDRRSRDGRRVFVKAVNTDHARSLTTTITLAVLVFAVAAGATSLDRWLAHRARFVLPVAKDTASAVMMARPSCACAAFVTWCCGRGASTPRCSDRGPGEQRSACAWACATVR